jgi:hypothetical protein
MVGVNVRIDNEVDAHCAFFRRAQVWLNLARRINHRRRGLSAASEKIGDANWILM